ncbi:MAG: Gldg family protein, partial [Planctomycetota bacterium]
PPSVGWLVEGRDPERFRTARDLLARRVDVVSLGGLAEGHGIDDLDAVCVVAPEELHPRTVYELDQYLLGGGDLLLVLDRSYASDQDLRARRIQSIDTGLEAWLASHGVEVGRDFVWDSRYRRPISLTMMAKGPGGQAVPRQVNLPYPEWPVIAPDGFDQANPATARLRALALRWAHPITLDQVPEGLSATRLLESSERSWASEFVESLVYDPELLERLEGELIAGAEPARQLVGVALEGEFSSPFAERGAPRARDPFTAEDRELPDPGGTRATGAGRLVVISDSDWLDDLNGVLAGESRVLFENLIDWLGLSGELLELRAKRPSDRTIDDFERDEFEARGLSTLAVAGERSELEAEALAAARARRRTTMASAVGYSGVAGLALLIGVLLRRRSRLAGVFEAGAPEAHPFEAGAPEAHPLEAHPLEAHDSEGGGA